MRETLAQEASARLIAMAATEERGFDKAFILGILEVSG